MESVNKTTANLANPYSVINLAIHIFKQAQIAAEEDWLLLNNALIDDIGAKQWLEELLDVLSLTLARYDGHDIINPSLVIKISDNFKTKHKLNVTRQQWIQTNVKSIEKLGVDKWLRLLLEALKTGNVPA